jgi:hypothetical protein
MSTSRRLGNPRHLLGKTVLRLHIRPWRSYGAVGNAHLDLPTPAAFRRLLPHDALHDVGKAYMTYVSLRLGNSVNFVTTKATVGREDFKPKSQHTRG